jgi:GNAT superfamily N-acetyltransferase
MALGVEDVGHRVVVRRIMGIRDNRPIFSDVLGRLSEAGETHLTVETAGGPVTVARSAIARAKRVPDKRALTATEALERVAAGGWPAPDLEDLGDWLLRAADGWTNRGNSALAIGDPGRPLAEAVDAVEEWYRVRGLRPGIMVPSPVGGRVVTELARRGWRPQPRVLVQTAALAAYARPEPEVRLDPAPSDGWLAVVAGRKGTLPAAARHILTAVPEVCFAHVNRRSGAPVAIARGAVADDGRWLGLSLIEVAPTHRRQGLGRAVMSALAGWGLGLGAERAYLQVEEHNTAAVALYESLGFTTHHTYETWNP